MSSFSLGSLMGRRWFWVVAVTFLFALPLSRVVGLRAPGPLPVLGAAPEFALTDEAGLPFASADLRGRVWVLGLADPRGGDHEATVRLMSRVQHRSRGLGRSFHMVSFAPAVAARDLAAYARAHRASPRMWSFLPAPDMARAFLDKWGPRVLLVDGKMQVRGAYDPADPRTQERLLRDIGLVANRGE